MACRGANQNKLAVGSWANDATDEHESVRLDASPVPSLSVFLFAGVHGKYDRYASELHMADALFFPALDRSAVAFLT